MYKQFTSALLITTIEKVVKEQGHIPTILGIDRKTLIIVDYN